MRENNSIQLAENIRLLSDITGLTVTNEKKIVALSRKIASVVVYDSKGVQIDTLGRWGGGPFEYRTPLIVKAYGDTVIVWDAGLLKFLFFRLHGKAVKEVGPFPQQVKWFGYTPGTFVLFLTGYKTGDYVAIYEEKEKKVVKTMGQRNNEHTLLDMYANSGGLEVRGSKVFYASPAQDKIYIYDLKTSAENSIHLKDNDFKVERTNLEPKTAADFQKVKSYLFNNSSVCGLYWLRNLLLVQIEDGSTESNTRITKLFFLDSKLRPVDVISLDRKARKDVGSTIVCTDGIDQLYFLQEISNDSGTGFKRILTSWKVDEEDRRTN